MADRPKTVPVRGMRDLLPAECELRDAATAVILDTYRRHGFVRIETPALEHLELLLGSQGGENEKLIYKVMKRGDKLDLSRDGLSESDLADAGLRYDLTVPLARYYAEHHAELPQPFRAIQIGPVWRAERPQKGRYRQFTQCDIDILGEAGPMAEVELLLATTSALGNLGLTGFTVRVNDRRLLEDYARRVGVPDGLRDDVFITLDKLDRLTPEEAHAQLVARGLDAEVASQALNLVDTMPADGEFGEDLRHIIAAVGASLGSSGTVTFDPTLVRGMGYYTGPIFEIWVEDQPFSIAGGGRYDRMIGRLGGRDVPATGFSIGFERLLMVLQDRGWTPEHVLPRVALVYDAAGDAPAGVMAAAASLREEGYAVTTLPRRKKLGKQLAELERLGYRGFVEMGKPLEVRRFEEA